MKGTLREDLKKVREEETKVLKELADITLKEKQGLLLDNLLNKSGDEA